MTCLNTKILLYAGCRAALCQYHLLNDSKSVAEVGTEHTRTVPVRTVTLPTHTQLTGFTSAAVQGQPSAWLQARRARLPARAGTIAPGCLLSQQPA